MAPVFSCCKRWESESFWSEKCSPLELEAAEWFSGSLWMGLFGATSTLGLYCSVLSRSKLKVSSCTGRSMGPSEFKIASKSTSWQEQRPNLHPMVRSWFAGRPRCPTLLHPLQVNSESTLGNLHTSQTSSKKLISLLRRNISGKPGKTVSTGQVNVENVSTQIR